MINVLPEENNINKNKKKGAKHSSSMELSLRESKIRWNMRWIHYKQRKGSTKAFFLWLGITGMLWIK